jgi:transposase-like protein
MVQNANNLPDEDKAELLAMIAEMQAKVSELEEL